MADPAVPAALLEGVCSERSGLAWPRAWAVVARSELRSGVAWGRGLLWRWRLWTWVNARLGDPNRCQACSGTITTTDPRAKTCSNPCRQLALRCRKAGRPTPHEDLVELARAKLAEAEREIRDAERWLERTVKRKTSIPPPDLLQYDHLPDLPPRCGKCEEGGQCNHTKGLCLRIRMEPRPPAAATRTP